MNKLIKKNYNQITDTSYIFNEAIPKGKYILPEKNIVNMKIDKSRWYFYSNK